MAESAAPGIVVWVTLIVAIATAACFFLLLVTIMVWPLVVLFKLFKALRLLGLLKWSAVAVGITVIGLTIGFSLGMALDGFNPYPVVPLFVWSVVKDVFHTLFWPWLIFSAISMTIAAVIDMARNPFVDEGYAEGQPPLGVLHAMAQGQPPFEEIGPHFPGRG